MSEAIGSNHDVKKLSMPVISLENEQKAIKLLQTLSEEQLKKYPEDYETDLKILEKSTLTYNQKNCISFRASEKKV